MIVLICDWALIWCIMNIRIKLLSIFMMDGSHDSLKKTSKLSANKRKVRQTVWCVCSCELHGFAPKKEAESINGKDISRMRNRHHKFTGGKSTPLHIIPSNIKMTNENVSNASTKLNYGSIHSIFYPEIVCRSSHFCAITKKRRPPMKIAAPWNQIGMQSCVLSKSNTKRRSCSLPKPPGFYQKVMPKVAILRESERARKAREKNCKLVSTAKKNNGWTKWTTTKRKKKLNKMSIKQRNNNSTRRRWKKNIVHKKCRQEIQDFEGDGGKSKYIHG